MGNGLFKLLGLGILAALVWQIGPREIARQIYGFGAWFAAICLLQLLWLSLGAAAWQKVQASLDGRIPLGILLRIKIIGDALNTLLPLANLGGDAARAGLMRSRVPLREGLAGVLTDKTFEFIGGILFMICGLGAALALPRLPDGFTLPALVGITALTLGIALFVLLQIRGFYTPLMGTVGRIGPLGRRLEARQADLRILEKNLQRFYTAGAGGMLTVALLHLSARFLGALEVWLIARVLGTPITLPETLFVSTAVTIGNTLFFIFPGTVGIYEGMHHLAMGSLGLYGPTGFSMGVLRRIRRMVFAAAGMLLYRIEQKQHRISPE
jgi:uncharacterized protein (TIRG00374 family)